MRLLSLCCVEILLGMRGREAADWRVHSASSQNFALPKDKIRYF